MSEFALHYHKPEPHLKGIDAGVNGAIGRVMRRGSVLRSMLATAHAIDRAADRWRDARDHDLKMAMVGHRESARRHGELAQDELAAALAVLREVAHRQLRLRPYVVQLAGALAMYQGHLAEMATGEGKTLTSGLVGVLFGWNRRPCHIVTVNDYLVERDCEWLRPLYEFCGVRVGCVTASMDPPARRAGYQCDVTYATSKELAADFLRDQLQIGSVQSPTRRLVRRMLKGEPAGAAGSNLVMRGLHTAVVDEADSVLIDEAVTPLIISAPRENESLVRASEIASTLAKQFERDIDYLPLQRYREVEFTRSGMGKLAQLTGEFAGIWKAPRRRHELVKQALEAREFFIHGKQYIVDDDGKIVIIDESTGRPMPDRSWREGMHQAIEAKEGVTLSMPSETIARISFQRFFRLYRKFSGMTGTAWESAAEFWQIYSLPVVRLPTNAPCVRKKLPDRFFATEDEKWRAIVDEIGSVRATGRPVLVGTRHVRASEHLADLLRARGWDFELLNAKRQREEARIIASAGLSGKITIATNMAGRGTDIKLAPGVAADGGLHVIATERHESSRVDRQLYGRSGRQGDPGSARAFGCLEDELLVKFLSKPERIAVRRAFNAHLPGAAQLAAIAIGRAQRRAQRLSYRQRRSVLKGDRWLEESLAFAGGVEP